jgi:hypothetical protein
MRKIEKPSPTEAPLLFEFDPKPAEEVLTALGGLPLVVQAFRSLGLPGSVKQHLVVKERQRGYDEATFVESFVLLNAAGGDRYSGRRPLFAIVHGTLSVLGLSEVWSLWLERCPDLGSWWRELGKVRMSAPPEARHLRQCACDSP